jgi:HK97 family phage major capsid protein
MSDLQGLLARENRPMTDEERSHFNEMRGEDDRLALECREYEIERSMERQNRAASVRQENNADVNFGRLMRSIASGRGVPEDLLNLRDAEGNFRFDYNRADAQLHAGDPAAGAIQAAESAVSITPVYVQDYIKELTPATVIGQVGAKIQSGISGQWNFPTVKGLKATWYGENEAVKAQTLEFGVKTIKPHRLPIRVDISRRTINQTAGAVTSIVTEAMRVKHTLALNEAFVAASPASNAPASPFAGITADNTIATKGNITTLDRSLFLNLRSKVNAANVPVNAPAFLMDWNAYAQLANTPVDKGSGRFVLDLQTNTIDGVPVVASSLVPKGTVYYGNFGYALVGQFGNMTMGIDTGSVNVLSANVISIVINSEWDFFAPYQEAFGKITYTAV